MRLARNNQMVRVEGAGYGGKVPPGRIHIVDGSGAAHSFSLYNPLVYYCVYGDDASYECLHLSLTSLARYGFFGGTVEVACDRPPHQLAKYSPEVFHHRLILSDTSSERGRFNQYYSEHERYDEFQPILYCSSELIFDASISDLLIDILLSGQIYSEVVSKAISL
jgi:hypothetical protein